MGKKSSTYHKLLKTWTKFEKAVNRYNDQANKKGLNSRVAMFAFLGDRVTAEIANQEFEKLVAVLGLKDEERI